MNRRVITILILGALALVVMAACAPVAAPTPAAQQPTAAPQATAATQATAAPQAGTVHVSIVNKDMTKDEIAAAIKQEGSVVVANWTYTANDAIVSGFAAVITRKRA